MGDISYAPLIEDMTWSYSRLKAFESCKQNWFLRYIRGVKDIPCFYTNYGSFMHRILEGYYSGKLTKQQMLTEFLIHFRDEVKGQRPDGKIVNKYILSGTSYISSFEPFDLESLWVEKRCSFSVEGRQFVGVIDFLGRSKDGELYLIDHKSRELKPRSGRANPTVKDRELDDMLRQLYLYCVPVFEEFGCFPNFLCFNCFKNGENGALIKEPFHKEAFEEAKRWALDLIRQIEAEEDFDPNPDYFFCKWLCGVNDKCQTYADEMSDRRR